jgi:hypothetical protein
MQTMVSAMDVHPSIRSRIRARAHIGKFVMKKMFDKPAALP